ncbi:MAG: glycosyltransferase family 9 protein [Stellaceae bacterium]
MRLLFITATRIGDAVLSTGVLGYLIERYPEARLSIAAGPLSAPIFSAVPNLDCLLVLEKRRFGLHWVWLYRQVMTRRWDIVIDLRGSAIAYLLMTGERRVVAARDDAEHRVVELARAFSLDSPPAPRLWLAPEHTARAALLLPQGGPVLALGPAANWRGKEWRAERFVDLALRLTAANSPLADARIAVLGATADARQTDIVLAGLPPTRRIDLVGKTDLLTAAAVLRRAALFVGNDSGLMHIAAAAGTPTLGLFGPSPIARYRPWGSHTAVAQTALTARELFPPGFDHRTSDTLMDSLSVEAAERATYSLLERVATCLPQSEN